jgi:hypothetical protein
VRAKQLAAASAASGILALGIAPALTPVAYATSEPVAVRPGEVVAGGLVTVIGTGCPGSHAVASSAAFATPIKLRTFASVSAGIGWIDDKARPGRFEVTLVCGPKTFTGWCTVIARQPIGPAQPGRPPHPTELGIPRGAAPTGDGASQASASSRPGTAAILAVAGALVAAVVLRRRRPSGGS